MISLFFGSLSISKPEIFFSRSSLMLHISLLPNCCSANNLLNSIGGADGETVGLMHRLTKSYRPPSPELRRPDGMEDLVGFAEKFLPPSEKEIIHEWNRMLDYLYTLPKGNDEYGLIHQDLHGGNFFVDDDGNMTIFDFDDSQYFWFTHDIAMCLFYVVPHNCEKQEDLNNARLFLKHFMEGYRKENHLDQGWILEIPAFLRLREMDLYIAIHRSMDLNDLTPWCASFMKNRKEKILNKVPYVNIRYDSPEFFT